MIGGTSVSQSPKHHVSTHVLPSAGIVITQCSLRFCSMRGPCVGMTYGWVGLQGMTASDLNSLAALLAEYQSNQAAAGGPAVVGPRAVDPMVTMSDPLSSLDASIKGAFSPGNVSLLKPWGQHMPEVISLHPRHS